MVEHARLIIDSFPVVASTWSFIFAGLQPLNSNRIGPEWKTSAAGDGLLIARLKRRPSDLFLLPGLQHILVNAEY
jgi:hypothetical protein